MAGNYYQLYKNARRHLRRTKENLIQPFEREVGKPGTPLKQGKTLSEERKKEIRERMSKENLKERALQRLKIFSIFGLMAIIYLFILYGNRLFDLFH